VWIPHHFAQKNWLPKQRPFTERKTNSRLFIYSRSSTDTANRVKIGVVDSKNIGLTKIDKNMLKNSSISQGAAGGLTRINEDRT